MKIWLTVAVNTTKAVVKLKPEKNSGLNGIWTHDLCDTAVINFLRTSNTVVSRKVVLQTGKSLRDNVESYFG